ncbi:beta-microseminoprotein J1-like [Vombatus ursinus]|uniref:Beta-microseminoprotein n=1 Tax=Vombatus ursinus TaxID=29139 RepID=A0A4X2L9P4_VOMUR|nr:beta-microseminoprotein J1-like [Vombatus ursinus]
MLSVLLSLAIFVTFCDAQCKYIGLEINPGAPIQGCRDVDGTMRKFGSQWLSDCNLCTCDETSGIECCSTLMRPIGYDTDKCKEIFNKFTCMFTVVQKNNPSIICKVTRYIGL